MKIVTAKEMSKLEMRAMKNGSIDKEFMEEAGKEIARSAHAFAERHDLPKQILLLCGKGNNAGDSYVAGIHLIKMGYSVDAFQLFPFKECSPLCQINQTEFFNAGGNVRELTSLDEFALPMNGLIIDGIFGTGFKGKIKEPIQSIIEKVNQSNLPIISVDIPSGLNGNTGMISKHTIIATETTFLGLPKIGFFLNDGFEHVGKLRYIDFGLPQKYIEGLNADFIMSDKQIVKPLIPKMKRTQNKYDKGYVAGFAGSKEFPGAAILASISALKAGSGIVKLYYPNEIENELQSSPYELIKISVSLDHVKEVAESLNKAHAVFIGPGIGTDKKTSLFLQKLLPLIGKPTVIDADALNILSKVKIKLPKETILTPHKKEMERLLGLNENQLIDLKFIEMCKSYAEKNHVTLILKGAMTFIFEKFQPVFINVTGDRGMATAGSGDVLTGILASLLAKNLSCHEASLLGTYLHGLSGEFASDLKTSYCLTATDLIDHFSDAYKALI